MLSFPSQILGLLHFSGGKELAGFVLLCGTGSAAGVVSPEESDGLLCSCQGPTGGASKEGIHANSIPLLPPQSNPSL